MKIAIDSGHGSNTAGKRTPDGYREHWANTRVAYFFSKAMERCGVSYVKTGWNDENATDDIDEDLTSRQKTIKSAGCDYSISFHFNASGDGKSYNSAQGVETLVHSDSTKRGDSLNLANKVQANLVLGTAQKNRGVKTQNLAMCNCKALGVKAAVLIECGFMTNKIEADLMASDTFCKECAEDTARGFCGYAGINYVAEGQEQTQTQAQTGTTQGSFLVKVIVNSLNIRSGAGTSYKVVGTIPKNGVYTITEVKGNWGKLKSGAGWINISSTYVKRV